MMSVDWVCDSDPGIIVGCACPSEVGTAIDDSSACHGGELVMSVSVAGEPAVDLWNSVEVSSCGESLVLVSSVWPFEVVDRVVWSFGCV